MNCDGTNLVLLTRNAAEDISPRWSPDGRRIIFSSTRNGKFGIYEVQIHDLYNVIYCQSNTQPGDASHKITS